MSRLFTIAFDFWGKQQTALVSMFSSQTDSVQFTVRFQSDDLCHVLPEGQLTFSSTDSGLVKPINSRAAEELFVTVKIAISKYLLTTA
jgi:hypothetical protein